MMVKRSLTIEQEDSEIRIHDIDSDGEVTMKIVDLDNVRTTIWIKKENLIELKTHIDYLCNKL